MIHILISKNPAIKCEEIKSWILRFPTPIFYLLKLITTIKIFIKLSVC